MILRDDVKLDFDDVLLEPQLTDISSRKEVELNTAYMTLHSKQMIIGTPIISANMSSVSTFNMAKALAKHDMFCALHKHYELSTLINFWECNDKSVVDHTFFTLGMHDLEKLQNFISHIGPPKLINLDVAHGGMLSFGSFVKQVRKLCPRSVIMAGNVVTPDGVKLLVDSGADIVKCGIGSGAACTSRLVAGAGLPQFSTIVECYEAAKKLKSLITSDGGIVHVGDFGKAFGAGANFVMCGSMFAGHDECDGAIVDGKMEYYGMSSEHAMNKHNGGMASHRASEGSYTLIDYKGPVEKTINTIKGGLRSTGSYINARKLSDFHKQAIFVRANRTHNKLFGN